MSRSLPKKEAVAVTLTLPNDADIRAAELAHTASYDTVLGLISVVDAAGQQVGCRVTSGWRYAVDNLRIEGFELAGEWTPTAVSTVFMAPVVRRSPRPSRVVIDRVLVVELLHAVVAEAGEQHRYDGPRIFGDVEYPAGSPRYVDNAGVGCCIVGRALLLAGVPARDLDAVEGLALLEIARDGLLPNVVITAVAAEALDAAQHVQDNGRPWGKALKAALAVVEKHISRPAKDHLTTEAGRVDARRALDAAELSHQLPHPLDVHPVPEMGRLDVHLADAAALASWATALHTQIVDHGPVLETHAVLDGHVVDLWALAGSAAAR